MTPVLMAVCLLAGFGLGWLTKRHRLGLLAENNHWVGEEIEALKGADLDADVARERALRLSGQQPAVQLYDQDADRNWNAWGDAVASMAHACCDFNGPLGPDGGLAVPRDSFDIPPQTGWRVQLYDPEGNRCQGDVTGLFDGALAEFAEVELDHISWIDAVASPVDDDPRVLPEGRISD